MNTKEVPSPGIEDHYSAAYRDLQFLIAAWDATGHSSSPDADSHYLDSLRLRYGDDPELLGRLNRAVVLADSYSDKPEEFTYVLEAQKRQCRELLKDMIAQYDDEDNGPDSSDSDSVHDGVQSRLGDTQHKPSHRTNEGNQATGVSAWEWYKSGFRTNHANLAKGLEKTLAIGMAAVMAAGAWHSATPKSQLSQAIEQQSTELMERPVLETPKSAERSVRAFLIKLASDPRLTLSPEVRLDINSVAAEGILPSHQPIETELMKSLDALEAIELKDPQVPAVTVENFITPSAPITDEQAPVIVDPSQALLLETIHPGALAQDLTTLKPKTLLIQPSDMVGFMQEIEDYFNLAPAQLTTVPTGQEVIFAESGGTVSYIPNSPVVEQHPVEPTIGPIHVKGFNQQQMAIINSLGLTPAETKWMETVGPPIIASVKAGAKMNAAAVWGQAILESAIGQSSLGEENNLWGMKEPYGWSGKIVTYKTQEQDPDGSYYTVTANWPVFASLEQGLAFYELFIGNHFDGAESCTKTARDYLNALQYAVNKACQPNGEFKYRYATSVHYVAEILNIVAQDRLNEIIAAGNDS